MSLSIMSASEIAGFLTIEQGQCRSRAFFEKNIFHEYRDAPRPNAHRMSDSKVSGTHFSNRWWK